jgi:hypothetical protein
LQVCEHVRRVWIENQPKKCDKRHDKIYPDTLPGECVSDVCQDKWYPGEEEIPNKPCVPPRIGVSHPCRYKQNADQAGCVKQYKNRDAVPVSINEIFDLVIH